MEGKIFDDSLSLTEDRARILYDYYRKAAEKIVIEGKIAVCEEESSSFANEKRKILLVNAIIAGGGLFVAVFALIMQSLFFLFLGLAAVIVGGLRFFVQSKANKKSILLKNEQIGAFREAHAAIRRDYKVSKLGVAYVPIASQIPFEGKSFFVDHTGYVPDMNFTLSAVRAPGELNASISAVQSLAEEIPVVETSDSVEEVNTSEYSTSIQNVPMYDYLGNLDREIRNISYRLKDVDRISVTLPVIMPNSGESEFIKNHATANTGDQPVLPVFGTDGSDDMIRAFNDLNAMKKGHEGRAGEYGSFFKDLMSCIARSTQFVVQSKLDANNRIVELSNKTFAEVLKASFNHYSPVIEAEEIERIRSSSFNYQDEVDNYRPFALKQSSRVKYDLFSGNWVAEDGSRTSMPFGMHQIQEEIIAPIVQNLMEETRIERLRIYNQIKDQKIDYLNQWHRDTEDFYGRNRAEANDLINRMRDALSEYMAAFNTFKALQKTDEQMGQNGNLASAQVDSSSNSVEAVVAFEAQAEQFRKKQEDFVNYMDRLKDDIDRKASEFGHIEFYEASLRDGETRKAAKSFDEIHSLDPRRKSLLAASPYFAACANIPPAPQMEDKLYEDLSIDLVHESERCLGELENVGVSPDSAPSAAGSEERE